MKKIFVCALALAMALLTGCGSVAGSVGKNENKMEYISAGSAKEVALSDSGINETEVKSISTELKSKDGRDYYEVDFSTDNEEVSCDVDALTGVILGSKHEKTGAPGTTVQEEDQNQPVLQTAPAQNETQASGVRDLNSSVTSPVKETTQTGNANQNQPALQTSPANNTAPANNSKGQAQNTNLQLQPVQQPQPNANGLLSEAKVKELVLARIPGATNANFVEFHKDYDDGRMEYEGKVIYQNTEYEFKIDAYSGAFRDWDVEFYPQLQPVQQPQQNTNGLLSEAKVKELVLARIPGATNANFVEFHKDYDDGRMEYEGKVIYQNMEYEFEIDAYSGAFRGWDEEFWWD